jgi:hypothetical protein
MAYDSQRVWVACVPEPLTGAVAWLFMRTMVG